MRQDIRTVYTAKELKEKFPEGFDRAWQNFKNSQTDVPWSDEIIDSMKGVFEAANIKLEDYEIDGICGHSYVKFNMEDEVYNLTGKRAFAWLENNILSQFRVKWGISHIKSRIWDGGGIVRHVDRKDNYFIHFAGERKECPFTGYFADEVFIDALMKDIKAGSCLGDAFKGIADEAGKLRSEENDNQQAEEYFLEYADVNEYEYTEDGKLV